eukprot:CAMPEP_0172727520 /NCGR_PEP_ID=MMETSP1074-20121228/91723_1 /TAXON_ID=2916 /ORGANISM="Ceratium fusus, Strain PA161109" /LENGTH=84 /DNA_ID=CAMNT_0013554677 /DNA_START=536 /DNA_END=790 /DNA_ORIENTATION=+
MVVDAVAMCDVYFPLACVCVAVAMGKTTHALRSVRLPLPLKFGTIRPHLNAKAMALIAFPLASVISPRLEVERWPSFHGASAAR